MLSVPRQDAGRRFAPSNGAKTICRKAIKLLVLVF